MRTIQNKRLDSEMFGENGRFYYVDLHKARNDRHYLQISQAKYKAHLQYERSSVIIFEENIGMLIEALTMLLTRYTHGEGRVA